MDGIHSYKHRSSTESFSGNAETDQTRVIIVDRRVASEPLPASKSKSLPKTQPANNTQNNSTTSASDQVLGNIRTVFGKPQQQPQKPPDLPPHELQFPSNELITSKYTIINFLPKNLFEQFRRLANFYFLVTAMLQVFVPFSPVGPTTSLVPLVFVVAATAVKQAYEDYLRHKLDAQVNGRICRVLRNKRLLKVMSRNVRVGDFVYVRNNEEIPCDMILLAASGHSADRCYVTTANLDGETSLKPRSCFAIKEQIGGLERLDESLLIVECERPNSTLYEFSGYMRAPRDLHAYKTIVAQLKSRGNIFVANLLSGILNAASKQHTSANKQPEAQHQQPQQQPTPAPARLHTPSLAAGARALAGVASSFAEVPLDTSNLLLRASRLRNTAFVYGLAIYTGKDTKLAHNSQLKPNKFSSTERTVNVFLLAALLLLALFTLIAAIRHQVLEFWNAESADSPESVESLSRFQDIIVAHFLLYNYLVPISLYVTLEFVKFIGSKSVVNDQNMRAFAWRSEASGEPTQQDASKEALNSSGSWPQSSQSQQQRKIDTSSDQDKSNSNSSALAPSKPNSNTSLASGKRVQVLEGAKCNSSDLNEELGQVQVLFSDKTGTLTENRMIFKACSASGRLYRALSGAMYEQPKPFAAAKVPEVSKTLALVATNRHSYLSGATSMRNRSTGVAAADPTGKHQHQHQHLHHHHHHHHHRHHHQPKSVEQQVLKLADSQSPELFDHRTVPPARDLRQVDDLTCNEPLAAFFVCVSLCSTISLNEELAIADCLPDRFGEYDYQSASPDEESFISAAHQFGVTLCKATDSEFFIAIKRSPEAQQQFAKTNGVDGRLPAPKAGKFKALIETSTASDKFVVRHFKRMAVFEFNSTRKRMSVIYKDIDNDCILMVSKGSELMLDCVRVRNLSHDEERTLNVTLAHFEAFARSGLRTMLVAMRVIGEPEVVRIMAQSKEARLSIHNREHLLTLLYQQAENDLTLIGATAVEDSLQTGVPETIASLKVAGIKVWLLTGDKVETAVSVAYLCKLLERDMILFHLVLQKDAHSCKRLLLAYRQQIKAMRATVRFEQRKAAANSTKSSLQQSAVGGHGRHRRLLWRSWLAWFRSHARGFCSPANNANAHASSTGNKQRDPATLAANNKSSCTTDGTDEHDDDDNDNDDDDGDDDDDDDNIDDLAVGVRKDDSAASARSGQFSRRRKALYKFALITDGRSLYYATKYAKSDLVKLCEQCTCVLGCRLSPMQKAEVVGMIKEAKGSPITAAVGDGANDVSMIQEAHVGIGVNGKEGKQAVNSSDFAISRFYMLNRLLFVHGHLFYHRTAHTIHYFFYKNLLFMLPQFVYSFYTNSSALSLYHPIFLVTFNLAFTSLPVLLYGIYEVHISERLLENYPRLYRLNKHNRLMKFSYFVSWLLLAAIQALLAFYILKLAFVASLPHEDASSVVPTEDSAATNRYAATLRYTSGSRADPAVAKSPRTLTAFSTSVYFVVVIVCNFELFSLAASHTFLFTASVLASIVTMPVLLLAYSKLGPNFIFNDPTLDKHFSVYFSSLAFWYSVIATSLVVVLPEIGLHIYRQRHYHATVKAIVGQNRLS